MISLIFLVTNVSACTLTPSLVNQDPILSIPGESVKVIFQVSGVDDSSCGIVTAELVEEYPFSLDPGYNSKITSQSGTYVRGFGSFLIVPYKLRIHQDALEGDQPIKFKISSSTGGSTKIHEFNLSVEDVRTDFIVTVDSYSFTTNELVFGLVNIGDQDAKSITFEIPRQEKISINGGHTKIIGDLDSNEDTTLSFSAIPENGEISVIISYNDQNDIRRSVSKTILFTEQSFNSTRKNPTPSISLILLWILVISLIFYIYWSRRKRKKPQHKEFD
jgi:hypothetical protein